MAQEQQLQELAVSSIGYLNRVLLAKRWEPIECVGLILDKHDPEGRRLLGIAKERLGSGVVDVPHRFHVLLLHARGAEPLLRLLSEDAAKAVAVLQRQEGEYPVVMVAFGMIVSTTGRVPQRGRAVKFSNN